MTKSISATIDELRGKLGAAEHRQVELNAEILEISWAAHSGNVKAKSRLDEITTELAHLAAEVTSITAALAEGARRQLAEQDAARKDRRRSDAAKAEVVLKEAEKIAERLDGALQVLRVESVAFEKAMIEVRQLSGGAGPRFDAARVFLVRALRSAVHRGPMHLDAVAPGEITTVQQVASAWSRQIRGTISAVLNNKTAAKEAA